ncbi:transmembrane protein 200C [Spea bombifrons]|uniref:transmembrane protein 200C n=1 Tax=Spea bombifrons TaxID=233779 RepID=UPI00234B8BF6|nr:transmembrane protein 200C [Spea bombifrons]XP_053323243.1 transmembrane protein 200C [Spea bombifrons]
MIATGGLLRISARKQDPLRPNSQTPKRKRKTKKKRKSDIVVVKGKLKLCSISGLIALCGILVLLVGIAMAVMGYWPKSNSVYHGSLGKIQAKYLSGDSNVIRANKNQSRSHQSSHGSRLDAFKSKDTNVTRSLQQKKSNGFIAGLFSGYLHSDNLKVFGPLIMGIGIFLFICANAVLHENRDKKTKIINLRDLYSTVIDVHGMKCKDGAPLNGFVNYVQSRGMDMKAGETFGAAMLAKSSWHSALGGQIAYSPPDLRETRTSSPKVYHQPPESPSLDEVVYSIYRERSSSVIPFDRSSGRDGVKDPLSESPNIGWGISSTCSIVGSSLNAFTLPVVKLDSCLLEKKDEHGAKEKSTKEVSSGEIELSLTNFSHADLNCEFPKTHRKILRRQSTSCLPDFRRSMSPGPLSDLGSQSLSSTDLDCSLLVKAAPYSKTKPVVHMDSLTSAPLIRKDSQSSDSDHLSNKGYIHLEEAGTSFESIDDPANKTQDCEHPKETDTHHPLEGTSKEQNAETVQKQYSHKEKRLMLSRSHAKVDDGLDTTGK